MNCCVEPAATDVVLGATEIEIKTGAVTVNVADPPIIPDVAVIVVAPCDILVAHPPPTLATNAADDVHVAEAVKSCVLPSVYVPVAPNCMPVPSGMVALVGVTAIDTNVGLPTVSVVEAEIEFDVAEIVAAPCPALVASP